MSDLLETTENGITTLTLNRPERLNALSPAMTAALKETLERLSTDRDCGAIGDFGVARVIDSSSAFQPTPYRRPARTKVPAEAKERCAQQTATNATY